MKQENWGKNLSKKVTINYGMQANDERKKRGSKEEIKEEIKERSLRVKK